MDSKGNDYQRFWCLECKAVKEVHILEEDADGPCYMCRPSADANLNTGTNLKHFKIYIYIFIGFREEGWGKERER